MRLDNHIVSECHFVCPIAIDPSSDVIGLKILIREARQLLVLKRVSLPENVYTVLYRIVLAESEVHGVGNVVNT